MTAIASDSQNNVKPKNGKNKTQQLFGVKTKNPAPILIVVFGEVVFVVGGKL